MADNNEKATLWNRLWDTADVGPKLIYKPFDLLYVIPFLALAGQLGYIGTFAAFFFGWQIFGIGHGRAAKRAEQNKNLKGDEQHD